MPYQIFNQELIRQQMGIYGRSSDRPHYIIRKDEEEENENINSEEAVFRVNGGSDNDFCQRHDNDGAFCIRE